VLNIGTIFVSSVLLFLV